MKKKTKTIYSAWFLAPAVIIFGLLFIIPTVISLFFSMTVWDLSSFRWVGLQNFIDFFSEYSLRIGIKNTFIYAAATCVLKVVIGLLFAVILTSKIRTKNLVRSIIFFPNLISTVAVGIIFSALMHPSKGLFNEVLGFLGIGGINWLGDRSIALYSVIMTDVWKGVGVATVIYIAGISAIPKDYYEAASLDGATSVKQFFTITIPLCRSSIIILRYS